MAVTKIPKRTVTVIEPKQSLLVDKEQHRQKRVCAYCRVSTDSEEQLTSYTTQKRVYAFSPSEPYFISVTSVHHFSFTVVAVNSLFSSFSAVTSGVDLW